ncbi:SWR1-complex protein 4/DNA methyltransferase 1-associated protein [Parasponia andersonii]|uniref:SWR1-complex protein 4/DNA methyltransferase 1-associated protein n=1 Tax=Parasponia andersonii TaxID=3476 RepID=A0A2P5CL57_PARAD|nr:SWR1-complex protein 4/DNA methyltransferase 1-associated protein [Parasponia andersonii]
MDAKDILGLPKNALPVPQEKKSRPQKDSQRKPDGISREVYALTGGVPPLMPSIDSKKRPPADEKITWQWLAFTSSARKDNLQLYHWVRVVNGVPPTGDYSFAKYNKSVDIVQYTDEEYDKHLADPTWTREETDQLFDLCKQFDLRFIVIADRFPSSRTVEELKDRYYNGMSSFPLLDSYLSSILRVYLRTYALDQMIQAARLLAAIPPSARETSLASAVNLLEGKYKGDADVLMTAFSNRTS